VSVVVIESEIGMEVSSQWIKDNTRCEVRVFCDEGLYKSIPCNPVGSIEDEKLEVDSAVESFVINLGFYSLRNVDTLPIILLSLNSFCIE
jgi:hypothetical protein